jgi:hypothetical protein
MDREDVRVLQPGGKPDFALEPIRPQGGGQLRMKHLQGDWPIVVEVVGEVYRSHATPAELTLDTVTVGKVRLELLEHCHRKESLEDF